MPPIGSLPNSKAPGKIPARSFPLGIRQQETYSGSEGSGDIDMDGAPVRGASLDFVPQEELEGSAGSGSIAIAVGSIPDRSHALGFGPQGDIDDLDGCLAMPMSGNLDRGGASGDISMPMFGFSSGSGGISMLVGAIPDRSSALGFGPQLPAGCGGSGSIALQVGAIPDRSSALGFVPQEAPQAWLEESAIAASGPAAISGSVGGRWGDLF